MSLISPCREWQNSIRQTPQLKIILVASIFIGSEPPLSKVLLHIALLILSTSDAHEGRAFVRYHVQQQREAQARLE